MDTTKGDTWEINMILIYFENPWAQNSYIQWNGKSTFNHGFFNKNGKFKDIETFTFYGKPEKNDFEYIKEYVETIFFNQKLEMTKQ
jgi:hypothetical protein